MVPGRVIFETEPRNFWKRIERRVDERAFAHALKRLFRVIEFSQERRFIDQSQSAMHRSLSEDLSV